MGPIPANVRATLPLTLGPCLRTPFWGFPTVGPLDIDEVHRALSTSRCHFLVTFIIIANSVYTMLQVNHEMRTLGGKPSGDAIVEAIFVSLYTVEILAKLYVHRGYFFVNDDMAWNWFDLILVLFSLFDQILSHIGLSVGSVVFARALRVFKMGKVLRVFRALRFLRELRAMVASIIGSFMSLFWCILMLLMILYIFSVFFVQQMTAYLIELQAASEYTPYWEAQRMYFETVQSTIITLAMCTTGGKDWEDVWRLIKPLGWFTTAAFLFYISFFIVALMNILTGIFVDSAMKHSKPDDKEALLEHRKRLKEETAEVICILQAIDTNEDGTLERSEFREAMQNERISHALSALGIDIKHADTFFDTLVDGNAGGAEDQAVDLEHLGRQIVRLKGNATSVDLHALISQTRALQVDMARLTAKIEG